MKTCPKGEGKPLKKNIIVLLAVLLVAGILVSGCPLKERLKKHKSTPKPDPVVKIEPVMTFTFDDKNNNNKFEPWYNEKLIEEKWFFRDNEDIIIFIPHEDARKGDEVYYCIEAPNGTKITNRFTLMSDGGCLKIQGGCTKYDNPQEKITCTKLGKYLVATGDYGTFEITAYLNEKELGKKAIKIWPKDKK